MGPFGRAREKRAHQNSLWCSWQEWGWFPPQALGRKTRENTEAPAGSTEVLFGDRCWFGLATVAKDVESLPGLPDPVPRPWLLDRQGWSTHVAGALLLLISFTTNYGNDNLLLFGTIPVDDQVGMGLHVAALAALAGDVQLATRLRHRDAWTREREAAARKREQAARRTRIQNGCLAAQCRFLLADSARNRLQLSEARAALCEASIGTVSRMVQRPKLASQVPAPWRLRVERSLISSAPSSSPASIEAM